METEMLVKNAKDGDRDALVRLIMAKKQDFYKLAYVFTGNREDALDAMEDMIVIIYESINKLKNNEAFYSWSKTILVNCCKGMMRKKKKLVYPENVPEKASDDEFSRLDEQIVLEGHFARLSAKHQEVLRLRYYLDWDYQTIADILRIPLGTVKSRISEGLNKLKKSLGGDR